MHEDVNACAKTKKRAVVIVSWSISAIPFWANFYIIILAMSLPTNLDDHEWHLNMEMPAAINGAFRKL